MNDIIGLIMSSFQTASAYAADAQPDLGSGGSIVSMLFPILIFVVIFYFLIYRPQKKKQQEHDTMTSSITRGDKVITIGGFYGRVADVREDSLILEISDGVKVRIAKSAISAKLDQIRRPDGGTGRPKKKRPQPEGAAGGEQTPQYSEGVTAEESSALIDPPAVETEEREQ